MHDAGPCVSLNPIFSTTADFPARIQDLQLRESTPKDNEELGSTMRKVLRRIIRIRGCAGLSCYLKQRCFVTN